MQKKTNSTQKKKEYPVYGETRTDAEILEDQAHEATIARAVNAQKSNITLVQMKKKDDEAAPKPVYGDNRTDA